MFWFLPKHKYCNLLVAFFLLCTICILMFPNTTPSKMPSLLFIRGHLTYYDSPIECHYYRQATVLHSGQILWDRATFISQNFLKFCSTSLFGFVMVDTDYQIIIFLNFLKNFIRIGCHIEIDKSWIWIWIFQMIKKACMKWNEG